MAIKYNSNTINDWNFGDDNIIKVYRNGAVCYYKFDSEQGGYKVCYAVVDDISQYSETEFEDVYDKATEKWYKLNNLNQYEQYGIYGSGRNITYYEGKLTIDDDYEYMYSGSSWVNVGEVSGSTATLPDVAFSVNFNANNYDANTKTLAKTSGQLVNTDAVITAGTPTVNDGYLTIASNTRATISGYQTYFNRDNSNPNLTIISKQRTDGSNCHMFANRDSSYNWMYRPYATYLTLHGGNEIGSIAVTTQPVIESVRVDSSRNVKYNNYTNNTTSTTSSFNYGSTNSGKFALFAGYATSSGEWFVGDFYWVYMSQNTLTDEQVQQVIDYNEGGSQPEYPLYYDEKSDPLDNLTFNSLEAAEEYAYNNCVYDGMRATIAGDRYYFDTEDENGWVKLLSCYTVEDVTSGGESGWTITGSSTYNPQPSYYDDFSTAPNSTNYQYKVAKVTIFGYESFTYYLRSSGYSSYAYVIATNVDELQSAPSSMDYDNASGITNTYDWNKEPGSAVNLSNYRRVTYNNLDKTVEHTFYVMFYNGYDPWQSNIATLLIPKEQDNENWEQVTISASTNVSGAGKALFIDNNNLTNYFCKRWIIGLPSGSHSLYTNFSRYDFCPNTTSSTFTSVAGEQRQVNFTYDSTSNKSLNFRLVDTNGNTLTPTDSVYYTLTGYNSCNISHSYDIYSYPRSFNDLKVDGKFIFGNSSNRHYIYGYSPNISLNTYYYTNDYQSYFDITYTKLDTEDVTISYTTYDPNDSETPAFNTEISWPYGNSGKTSNTLTSYEVPYTYSYEVSENSGKFSASTYEYTASQASRTISFTLYPDNREFSTVADMEAYQYAWEGMKASVDDTNYKYENGEWVENAFNQYEYISTVGTRESMYKFDTGFYPTTANTIEIKMQMTGTSVDWGMIFGWASCDGDRCDNTQYRFTTVSSGYALIARKGNTSGVAYYTIGSGKDVTCTIPISSSTWSYTTGGSITTCNVNVGTFINPSTTALHLFSLGNSTGKKSMKGRIYYVKVYDGNGNLVKHYVPSDNNGTPCFYEIINGNYIMNTWTGSYAGTLTLGPQI